MINTSYNSAQPVNDFGLRFADLLYSVTLTASTDTTLTIPGYAPSYKMLVKASDEVWMAYNKEAALPDPPVVIIAETTSEMIPAGCCGVCREVDAGDVIHFIAASAVDVSVVLYSLRSTN